MRTPFFLVAALAAVAPAQLHLDPRPQGALVTFECDGPARWAERFAGTRIAKLVASKEFVDVLAPLRKAFEAQVDTAKQQAPFDTEALLAGVQAYAGRARAVLSLQMPDDLESEEPKVAMYLALGSDGSTDLEAFCKEVERVALQGQTEFAPVSLAGVEWLSGLAGEIRGTLPRMVGDQAVLLIFSPGQEAQIERFFVKEPPQAERTGDKPPAPLSVRLALGTFMQFVSRAIEQTADEPELPLQLLTKVLGEIGDLGVHLDRAGEFVDMSLALDLPGPRGTLLQMFVPPADAVPPLLAYVPRQHENFSCGPVDLGQIEPLVRGILDAAPDAPMDWEGVEAMFEESTGVRLGPDVLAHLGRAYVLLSAAEAEEPMEADEFTAMFGAIDGLCLGLELEDGAALARSLETILDRSGALRMRKTDEYREQQIHRLTIPLVDQKLHWVVTEKLLVLAIGDQGRTNLQSLLDGALAAARGEKPAPFPNDLTERLATSPPGYCSLSFQSMTAQLAVVESILLMDEEAFEVVEEEDTEQGQPKPSTDLDPQVLVDVLRGLRKLLATHKVEHVVSVGYHGKNGMRQHQIW